MENREGDINSIRIMHNGIYCITSHLYPKTYKQDKKLYDALLPYIKTLGNSEVLKNDVYEFSILVDDFLLCVDEKYNAFKWIARYREVTGNDTFDANLSAAALEFTAAEVVYLQGICRNLTKMVFVVHQVPDERKHRIESDVFPFLFDIRPTGIAINLRDYFEQDCVDLFNKYGERHGFLKNNVQDKTNMCFFDGIESFMNVFENIIGEVGSQDFANMVYEKLKIFDMLNFDECLVSVVTDYMIL